MGFFSFLNFRKLNKLTKEDIVEARLKLEKEEAEMQESLIVNQSEIDELMAKGKKEKDKNVQKMYAKKINFLKSQNLRALKKIDLLLYNIKMMTQLQDSVEDNAFFKKQAKNSINLLLKDQEALNKFLNQALVTKMTFENTLTEADDTFEQVNSQYEEDERIYGVNENDDSILAIFENSESLDEIEEIGNIENQGEINRFNNLMTEDEK